MGFGHRCCRNTERPSKNPLRGDGCFGWTAQRRCPVNLRAVTAQRISDCELLVKAVARFFVGGGLDVALSPLLLRKAGELACHSERVTGQLFD